MEINELIDEHSQFLLYYLFLKALSSLLRFVNFRSHSNIKIEKEEFSSPPPKK